MLVLGRVRVGVRVRVIMPVTMSMPIVVVVPVLVPVIMSVIMPVPVPVIMSGRMIVIVIVPVLVLVFLAHHGLPSPTLAFGSLRMRWTAIAAPKPLSMLTTTTPEAQLVSMAKSAVKPPSAVP